MESYCAEKKQAPQCLGRVLVLGLGKSGRAASAYCARLLGARVTELFVAAGAPNPEARDFADTLQSQGAQVVFESQEFPGHFDLCIASPGISENSDFYHAAKAASDEVISEVEFAWRESAADSTWVAITGTNGKTTTTALCAHVLRECGKNAAAVGNIGDTCLDAVAQGNTDCYVAEVSSYQLASTRNFKPDVAVLLNITPDHLKWHGSFEAYVQAKRKVYAACDAACTVVMDATDTAVRDCVKEARANGAFQYIPIGCALGLHHSMIEACGSRNAAFVDKDMLVIEVAGSRYELVRADELQIKGEHNASNALAAASAAIALGCDAAHIATALKSFAPLEHRIEPAGSVAGVRCYNDSKATNVDATLKALAAFTPQRPIVLLGGDDKGTDLSELVRQAQRHCKAVVCFGAGGPRFLAAFEGSSIKALEAPTLEPALDVALEYADAGDIVLLSPACASFDEFSCFEERGCVFKELVKKRASERGA